MVAFVALAVPVLATSLISGSWVLARLSRLSQTPDRAVIACWIGLLLLADALLLVSVFAPVDAIAGLLVLGVLNGIGLSRPDVRAATGQCLRQLITSKISGSGIAMSLVAVGAYVSRVPLLYDTGLYHYQFVKWLASHGAVEGLALLHGRFGFVSSWFALSAPLEDLFPTRAAPLASGFVLVLVVLHAAVLVRRVMRGRASVPDVALLIGLAGAAVAAEVFGFWGSLGPDVVLFFVPLVGAWLVAETAEVSFDVAAVVAALSVPVKLTAVPLLAVIGMGLVAARPPGRRVPALARLALAAGAIWLPVALVSWVHSGCFQYPVALTCVERASGVGMAGATEMSDVITSWARWGSSTAASDAALGWVPYWLQQRPFSGVVDVVALLALGWLTLVAIRRRSLQLAVLTLVPILGLAVTYVAAPDMRFQVGYLGLPVAGAAAMFAARWIDGDAWRCRALSYGLVALMLVGVLGARTVLAGDWASATSEGSRDSRWLVPPSADVHLVHAELREDSLGPWVVLIPAGSDDRCWSAPLPCTPYLDLRIEPRGADLGAGLQWHSGTPPGPRGDDAGFSIHLKQEPEGSVSRP